MIIMNQTTFSILIWIFILSNLNCNCQDYESIFGDNSTIWYSAREAIDRVDNIKIIAESDTIINTKEYIKLDIQGIYNTEKFLLREDVASGKVWIYILETQTEYLIMNMSLQKGDDFKIVTPDFLEDSIAVVDSVFFVNGTKHIQLDYELQIGNTFERLEFIEGVGPNSGLLYQCKDLDDNISYAQLLLCVYKDDILEYKDIKYASDQCTYLSNFEILQRINPKDVLIYPNPSTDYLYVVSPLSYSGTVQIYNINGELINKEYIEGYSTTINISDYANGVYYLIIYENESSYNIGKFIKQSK